MTAQTPKFPDYCLSAASYPRVRYRYRTSIDHANSMSKTNELGALTRHQDASKFDRCHESVAALIAQPVMVDTAAGAEARFFGDQQRAAATRTIRPAETSVGIKGL
jgi:hypothetical protein